MTFITSIAIICAIIGAIIGVKTAKTMDPTESRLKAGFWNAIICAFIGAIIGIVINSIIWLNAHIDGMTFITSGAVIGVIIGAMIGAIKTRKDQFAYHSRTTTALINIIKFIIIGAIVGAIVGVARLGACLNG